MARMRSIVLVITRVVLPGLACLLAACAASRPEYRLSSGFDKVQAARTINALGSGRITGNAHMYKSTGERVTCAGVDVVLIPATAYAAERMKALYGSSQSGFNATRAYNFVPDVSDFHDLIIRSKCDADGRFVFDRLGAGAFYVVTAVRWSENTLTRGQGGSLMQRVSLRKGQKRTITLTLR